MTVRVQLHKKNLWPWASRDLVPRQNNWRWTASREVTSDFELQLISELLKLSCELVAQAGDSSKGNVHRYKLLRSNDSKDVTVDISIVTNCVSKNSINSVIYPKPAHSYIPYTWQYILTQGTVKRQSSAGKVRNRYCWSRYQATSGEDTEDRMRAAVQWF
jgi:hypothetical protein